MTLDERLQMWMACSGELTQNLHKQSNILSIDFVSKIMISEKISNKNI